jgi:hypothetical protein
MSARAALETVVIIAGGLAVALAVWFLPLT